MRTMDYEKELMADLGSDLEPEEVPQSEVEASLLSLDELLRNSESFVDRLHQFDVAASDVSSLSRVKPVLPELRTKLDKYSDSETTDYLELLSAVAPDQNDEYLFLMQINGITTLINTEIDVAHLFVKHHYKPVFGELETLVPNGPDYAKVVLLVKQDLANIKAYEDDLKVVVSPEKVLVIVMSALQAKGRIPEAQLDTIMEACYLILELADALKHISQFISAKLAKFAPNVTAIVGPVTASQLLISTGSLQQLAATPACNIASFGVKDLAAQTRVRNNAVRATGYLYHSEILNFLPVEILRPAMRIVSAKVVLAARVDLSKLAPDGSIGAKYLDEIHTKIEKLLTPPAATIDKALPAPIEQKSKKRGGRRFRKMKERFQMSELRRAQNKMEFGKQEDTFTDAFGEEVGLGMSRSANIQVNANTGAKMSKAMVARLQQQKQKQVDLHLDEIVLAKPTEQKQPERRLTMKRRLEE